MELDGALGDIEFAGDFLVGKILEKRIENFLFAAAEVGDRVGLQAAPLSRICSGRRPRRAFCVYAGCSFLKDVGCKLSTVSWRPRLKTY